MDTIREIFFLPPMAVARLGPGETPLESYEWQQDMDAHGNNKTVIRSNITFREIEDGSVTADDSLLLNAGVAYRLGSLETRLDVFNLLDSDDSVGLATVYRVLAQFENVGIVTRHNFEGGHSVYALHHSAGSKWSRGRHQRVIGQTDDGNRTFAPLSQHRPRISQVDVNHRPERRIA